MPHCLEDTGGFFVITPWDNPGYTEKFRRGCRQATIEIDELTTHQMLREEPLLNPKISRCFRLPDASADSFMAAHVNVKSAAQYGAQTLLYHEVRHLLTRQNNSKNPSVVGALCFDLVKDEEVEIYADLVVNAAGAWVGKIGKTIGLEIKIRPGKGTMVALNHRVINTVVNRCKLPSDGDIIVPTHTVAVIGTTDEQVTDPDHFGIEPWEVRLMLEEGEKLIPGFRNLRILRAWAGVRPLYQETKTTQSREITRTYVLLDHQERDGVSGLVTITSGKWTTYRLMAEVTVDKVCEKLGTQRACLTAQEELPKIETPLVSKAFGDKELLVKQSSKSKFHRLGERLANIEHGEKYSDLICECELATLEDVQRAIFEGEAKTLDDIRRDVRLGMGPCQGGFCTLRAAGILYELRQGFIENANTALRDFLQERWKGLLPILWGQQLRQERLNELIYLHLLAVDRLPGEKISRLGSEPYAPARSNRERHKNKNTAEHDENSLKPISYIRSSLRAPVDVLVIGAGFAGLTAAWRAASQGMKVKVVSKGLGSTHWGAGCIDVLGSYPTKHPLLNDTPLSGIKHLIKSYPDHPYACIGLENITASIQVFSELCERAGYAMQGSLENNWLLPTSVGAFRPTCLIPETMIAGDWKHEGPTVIVGFEDYLDFYPHFIAANLNAQGQYARAIKLRLESLLNNRTVNNMRLARLFDRAEFRRDVASNLKARLGDAHRVGFPAVLGLEKSREAHRDLESLLEAQVFEIPTLPPSIPGIRLNNILIKAIQEAGGRVEVGLEAIKVDHKDGHVEAVYTEAASRLIHHQAACFILATGGILGGGIQTTQNGNVFEPIFRIPVQPKLDRNDWFRRDFLSAKGHPIYQSGVRVDDRFQPTDSKGKMLYENVYVVGNQIAHSQALRERSHEGIAIASGYAVGENINIY
jgi:glycerol-3-phosphate dehydrogenase